ncbi:MAG: arylsulfatase [Planctomycetota bacterium]|jgi:arylsulfatase A-like enzyme
MPATTRILVSLFAVLPAIALCGGCVSAKASQGSAASTAGRDAQPTADRPPNVVLLFFDDLGVGDLGCTGSPVIRTPHIDAIAREGMMFTQAYSAASVCAPSRASLLTGLDLGRCQIRDNKEVANLDDGTYGGQPALEPGTETIATALRRRGYATMATGKWGLGGPGEMDGHPLEFGFDRWYGYLCQRNAHNFYPRYLFDDREQVPLEGNDRGLSGEQYAPDLMREAVLDWLDTEIAPHPDRPFFIYYATIVPHLALQAPEESVAEYRGEFEDFAYDGKRWYLPCEEPRATYAAMISRADADFGAVVDRIEAMGLAEDTVYIVTSDNGATWDIGGFDPDFFQSNRELRGHKTQLYEGGLRVPFIATWPGRIEAGSECDLPVVGYDLFPTILEIAGAESATEPSGIALVSAFEGDAPSKRPPLYWEQPSGRASVAARFGNHKAIRQNIRTVEDPPIEIYDLAVDPNETTDLAPSRPDLVAEAEAIFAKRTPSREPRWNPTYEPPPPPVEDGGAANAEIPSTALKWTGDGGSSDPRDPANWAAEEGVDIEAAVVGSSPIESVLVVDLGPDGAVAWPTIDFAGDGGLVLQSGRIEGARAGLRGGFVEVRGGLLERQFLAQSRGTVSSGATLRLTGAHLPLNGATVGLERGGVVELPGLDADAARSRALPRIEGEPPPSLRVRGEDSTTIVTSS